MTPSEDCEDGVLMGVKTDLKEVDMARVGVCDPYLVNAARRELDYLISFDPDRLLVEFRRQSGLDSKGLKNYGGWERGYDAAANPDGTDLPDRFTGHFVGHYLTAISQALASTFVDGPARRGLLERQRALVLGLRQAQEAYARLDHENAGFLPAFKVDALPGGKEGLIVPFYNLHKVEQGLIDVCRLSTDRALAAQALEAAGDFALFVVNWHHAHPDVDMLAIEYGGMNDALYQLYAITGDPVHLQAAHLFDETALFRRLAAGEDCLPGLHANATIPKVIGALRRYLVLGGRETGGELHDLYFKAAENFWSMVVDHHTYLNGDNSQAEHFHEPDALWRDATGNGTADGGYNDNSTSETCNAHNMLKLTRLLLQCTGEARYSEYYEHTFINAVLASQNSRTGMTTYFQPMEAGYPRVFGTPTGEFWCCQGSGIENFTKLNDSVYFTGTRGIYVNLFLDSTLEGAAPGLRLRQEADLLGRGEVTFSLEGDTSDPAGPLPPGDRPEEGVDLRLRLPSWARREGVRLCVNGREIPLDLEDGWVRLTLAPGDRAVYKLPLRLRPLPAPDNPTWVGFAYGPYVLAGILAPTNPETNYAYGGILVRVGRRDDTASHRAAFRPSGDEDLNGWLDALDRNLVRTGRSAGESETVGGARGRSGVWPPTVPVFRLQNVEGPAADVPLVPYFALDDVAYALYFDLSSASSVPGVPSAAGRDAEAGAGGGREAGPAARPRVIDTVTPDQGNNIERGKALKASPDSRSLVEDGRAFRDAGPGGWFSYELSAGPHGGPVTLAVLVPDGVLENPGFEVRLGSSGQGTLPPGRLALSGFRILRREGEGLVWIGRDLPAAMVGTLAPAGTIRVLFASTGGRVGPVYGVRIEA